MKMSSDQKSRRNLLLSLFLFFSLCESRSETACSSDYYAGLTGEDSRRLSLGLEPLNVM